MRAHLDLQRHRRTIAATSVAFLLLLGSSRAHAQSAEAEGLFNDGNKLMDEGHLAQACDAFEASNRVEPRAGTLLRLAECREKNQQLASAWSAYKDALSRAKDPRKRELASAKAKALKPRISYLTVSVPDENRIEGLTLTRSGQAFDQLLWNRPLAIDGGDYVIVGRAPGHSEWQVIAHVPVEGAKIKVEVPKLDALSTPPPTLASAPNPTLAPAPPSVAVHPDRDPAPSSRGFTTRRKLALGAAAGSALAVAAGIALAVTAKGKQSDAHALCSDPQIGCDGADRANELIRSGHNLGIGAGVALGVGGAAAIAAGVLWFTGAQESPHRLAILPDASNGQFVVTAGGTF
jgi:hypothetical protein